MVADRMSSIRSLSGLLFWLEVEKTFLSYFEKNQVLYRARWRTKSKGIKIQG